MVKFSGEKKQGEKLAAIKKEEEEELAQVLSEKYNLPYVNLAIALVDLDALSLVSESEAKNAGIAIISKLGKKLKIAVRKPNSEKTKALINKLKTRYKCELYYASESSLNKAYERYSELKMGVAAPGGTFLVSKDLLEKIRKEYNSHKKIGELINEHKNISASELLKYIMGGAFGLGASDIHLETRENNVMIRYRFDGILYEITTLEHKNYTQILSRIKLLSKLKLNVKNRAQDGRFTVRFEDIDVEIRTSSLPGPSGESIVMRVLNPKTIGLTLDDLGMQEPVYKLISKELKKPKGMILTTGPTGSGKTTTLYAFVKKIKSESTKIITIENPIEYHVEGITQTQVSLKGSYTFDKGLQAILRQDPDVILVGEIRNLETAQTAMRAALTGHLVFSTLHTNNAPATIPRLIDLGANTNIIAPAINVAMAQRLLRKLCDKCRIESKPTKEEKDFLDKILADLPSVYEKPNTSMSSIWKVKGCEICGGIGYKGRIGIYEVFLIDEEMERLILQNPTEGDVRKVAKEKGMLTLHQDGALKILNGTTTIEEIIRVAGEV